MLDKAGKAIKYAPDARRCTAKVAFVNDITYSDRTRIYSCYVKNIVEVIGNSWLLNLSQNKLAQTPSFSEFPWGDGDVCERAYSKEFIPVICSQYRLAARQELAV